MPQWTVQLGLEGGTSVAAWAGPAGSGHPGDEAGLRVDSADRAVRQVGGADVALAVEGQAVGPGGCKVLKAVPLKAAITDAAERP